MPQVDHVTYLPIIFWLSIVYLGGFLLVNARIFLTLSNIQKNELNSAEEGTLIGLICNKFARNFFKIKMSNSTQAQTKLTET